MVKSHVCYKKNCWSTKNTVLGEAENREDDHFKEELDRRIEAHSHKKNHKLRNVQEKEKFNINKEIREYLRNISYKKSKRNVYLNNNYKIEYKLDKTYLNHKKFRNDENSKLILDLSNHYDKPEYEEFMIEKTPIGSIKVANFNRTNVGMLKKLGLIPDYNINIFSRN